MKKIKTSLFALFLVAGFSNVSAQNDFNPWAIGIGINSVDFYPTNNAELKGIDVDGAAAGGDWFEEFYNENDHYNTMSALTRVYVTKYLQQHFSVQAAFAVNEITKIGEIKVDNLSYFGLDFTVKYSTLGLVNTGIFEPYLFLGGGYVWHDYEGAPTVDAGIGLNVWLGDHFGLNIGSAYKHSFEDATMKPHFQHVVGVVFRFGGKDTDGDGFPDSRDDCPDVFGLEAFNGCPDTDADGIVDSEDNCPYVAGEFGGCPDTDSDNISDDKDNCPDVAGPVENNGCPWPDTDGDGITDNIDLNVTVAGPIENNGAPWPDADGDGVADKDDKCPDVAGNSPDGCASLEVLPESVKVALRGYASTIRFEKNKEEPKEQHPDVMKQIADIILEYPGSAFVIEGHASDTGSDAVNQRISEGRAESVKQYLVSKGVDGSLITTKGYGKSKPLNSAKTEEARNENRRVEIKLAL